MIYAPFNYDQLNIASGTYSPSTVKSYNNQVFKFWERALYQRAISVIDFEGLPFDGAVKDFFQYCLYSFGFVGFIDAGAKLGKIFQPGTLNGFDLYYQPTRFLIANPYLPAELSKEYEIGTNCELLKLSPDYFGITDVITYFAERMATIDGALNMSLINSKFAFIIGAKNKASAKAIKHILDEINKGNPAVVYDKDLLVPNDPDDKKEPWQLWDRHVKESYITSDLLQDQASILRAFDSEIGIPTIPYEKKERMVTSEADSKTYDAISRSTVWLNTLNDSLIKVNEFLGTDIRAKLHYEDMMDEGSEIDGETDTV